MRRPLTGMPVALDLRDQTRPASAQDPGGHAGSVRGRLRAVPPSTRAALALVVVLFTAAPVAMTLVRPDAFTSTFTVAQQDASQPPYLSLDERVTGVLRGVMTQPRIAALRDVPGWSPTEVSPDPVVDGGPRPGTVRVTIRADTPERSQDLARAFAGAIAAHGRRTSRQRAAAVVRRREIEATLDRRDVSRARRSRLREEAVFIRLGLPGLVALRVIDPPTALQPAGPIDRLDPSGVPRPDPVWAGAVGLMLGLALCSLWLTLRGRSSHVREQAGDGHTS